MSGFVPARWSDSRACAPDSRPADVSVFSGVSVGGPKRRPAPPTSPRTVNWQVVVVVVDPVCARSARVAALLARIRSEGASAQRPGRTLWRVRAVRALSKQGEHPAHRDQPARAREPRGSSACMRACISELAGVEA